jgi:hypothetical protein
MQLLANDGSRGFRRRDAVSPTIDIADLDLGLGGRLGDRRDTQRGGQTQGGEKRAQFHMSSFLLKA